LRMCRRASLFTGGRTRPHLERLQMCCHCAYIIEPRCSAAAGSAVAHFRTQYGLRAVRAVAWKATQQPAELPCRSRAGGGAWQTAVYRDVPALLSEISTTTRFRFDSPPANLIHAVGGCQAAVRTKDNAMDGLRSHQGGFVVKATNSSRDEGWLCRADRNGYRDIGERRRAAVFSTKEQAQLAIATMGRAYRDLGVTFSVEPAD
jgi:hypothetical protein